MSENFKIVREKNEQAFRNFCEYMGAEYSKEEAPSKDSPNYYRIAHICKLPTPTKVSVQVGKGDLIQVVARQTEGTPKKETHSFWIERENIEGGFNQMAVFDETKQGRAHLGSDKSFVSGSIETLADTIRIHNLIPVETDSNPNEIGATDQFVIFKKKESEENNLEM